MSFLLSEDNALRKQIEGVTVTDQKATGEGTPRPVRVYFGQPDQELTNQAYPYITIDMIDINRANDREMRGLISDVTPNAGYLAPDVVDADTGWQIHTPIPVDLVYQITTYARHPRHDRELLAKVLYEKLPLRFGVLVCDDGTIRRLDVINTSKRDVTESAKRLFVNAITVQVSSEISQATIQQLYKVLQVNVDTLEARYAGGTARQPQFNSVDPFTISA
jgi:hypothetical protein